MLPHGKLTLQQKLEILSLQKQEGPYIIAKKYGVSPQAIYKIFKNREKIINQTNNLNMNQVVDTAILKKMLPHFVNRKIKINFEEIEINRLKELAEEVL